MKLRLIKTVYSLKRRINAAYIILFFHTAAAIEYPDEIDTSPYSTDKYEILYQTIISVYTHSQITIIDSNICGNFVFLKLASENTENVDMGDSQNPDNEEGNPSENDGGVERTGR